MKLDLVRVKDLAARIMRHTSPTIYSMGIHEDPESMHLLAQLENIGLVESIKVKSAPDSHLKIYGTTQALIDIYHTVERYVE